MMAIRWKTLTLATLPLIGFTAYNATKSIAQSTAEHQAEMAADSLRFAKDSIINSNPCGPKPQWDKHTCNLVSKHHVEEGMSRDQARAAWGTPTKINTDGASDEEWIYPHGNLYFHPSATGSVVLTTITSNTANPWQ